RPVGADERVEPRERRDPLEERDEEDSEDARREEDRHPEPQRLALRLERRHEEDGPERAASEVEEPHPERRVLDERADQERRQAVELRVRERSEALSSGEGEVDERLAQSCRNGNRRNALPPHFPKRGPFKTAPNRGVMGEIASPDQKRSRPGGGLRRRGCIYAP